MKHVNTSNNICVPTGPLWNWNRRKESKVKNKGKFSIFWRFLTRNIRENLKKALYRCICKRSGWWKMNFSVDPLVAHLPLQRWTHRILLCWKWDFRSVKSMRLKKGLFLDVGDSVLRGTQNLLCERVNIRFTRNRKSFIRLKKVSLPRRWRLRFT